MNCHPPPRSLTRLVRCKFTISTLSVTLQCIVRTCLCPSLSLSSSSLAPGSCTRWRRRRSWCTVRLSWRHRSGPDGLYQYSRATRLGRVVGGCTFRAWHVYRTRQLHVHLKRMECRSGRTSQARLARCLSQNVSKQVFRPRANALLCLLKLGWPGIWSLGAFAPLPGAAMLPGGVCVDGLGSMANGRCSAISVLLAVGPKQLGSVYAPTSAPPITSSIARASSAPGWCRRCRCRWNWLSVAKCRNLGFTARSS